MENPVSMSREEMQKAIEKAQRDLEETLAKMTPEERAQAEERAKRMLAEDEAKRQRLLEDAARVAAGLPLKKRPKFCPNCGTPVSGGRFCTNCGNAL